MKLTIQGKSAYAYSGGRPFERSRPCVVMIHGAQHDHSVWILQSRYLAHHGFSVLAIDLPGHGRSAGPALKTIEDMALWVLELVSAADVANAMLVGHSMGALVALETAARAAERITRVALIGVAYPMKVSDALLDAARSDEARAIDMINIWSHSANEGGFSHKPSNPGPGFNINWGNLRLMERQQKGVLLTDFNACNTYVNGARAAQAVHCPTLLLLGEKDAMTPAKSGNAFAASIERHHVTVLPGSGHALMQENPDAVLDTLFAFLGQT
jgi:pimeloyl-ACP methyl ester carboxylesterase